MDETPEKPKTLEEKYIELEARVAELEHKMDVQIDWTERRFEDLNDTIRAMHRGDYNP